jgi:hypothetical protein
MQAAPTWTVGSSQINTSTPFGRVNESNLRTSKGETSSSPDIKRQTNPRTIKSNMNYENLKKKSKNLKKLHFADFSHFLASMEEQPNSGIPNQERVCVFVHSAFSLSR